MVWQNLPMRLRYAISKPRNDCIKWVIKPLRCTALLSGRVRLSIIGRLGQEFALTELEPLYWLGEASLEPDGTRIQEARVKADADVMLLPRAAVF